MLEHTKQFFAEWRRGVGEWYAKEMFAKLIAIIEDQQAQIDALKNPTVTEVTDPKVKK